MLLNDALDAQQPQQPQQQQPQRLGYILTSLSHLSSADAFLQHTLLALNDAPDAQQPQWLGVGQLHVCFP
jgi:hypothetical protein